MAHDDAMVNTSGTRSFSEVLEVNQRRRQILLGGLATAAAHIVPRDATTFVTRKNNGTIGR